MLKVMAVFSEMQMNLYNSLPITIAKNVPFETVTEIETKSMMLPGMDISESTQRVYPKQTLAAQVIGYIGKIPSRTMWLTLQAKGYSYNDTIGRDGIESSMQGQPRRRTQQLVENRARNLLHRAIGRQQRQADAGCELPDRGGARDCLQRRPHPRQAGGFDGLQQVAGR